jgi:iron-sulfur cluster assembly accessory protein
LPVQISDKAKSLILKKLEALHKPILFLSLQGGGCAGFEYSWSPMDHEEYPFHGDDVLDIRLDVSANAFVAIDAQVLDKLDGSTIDVIENFIGDTLVVTNPNAKASCGCGTSISL